MTLLDAPLQPPSVLPRLTHVVIGWDTVHLRFEFSSLCLFLVDLKDMENMCVDGHPYVRVIPFGDNVRGSFHALRVGKQVPGAIKWDNAVRQTKQHSQVKYRVLRENFYDSITECEGVLELLIG
jgi:hypothetical protein